MSRAKCSNESSPMLLGDRKLCLIEEFAIPHGNSTLYWFTDVANRMTRIFVQSNLLNDSYLVVINNFINPGSVEVYGRS